MFCRDKKCVCFVTIKIILLAAPANDTSLVPLVPEVARELAEAVGNALTSSVCPHSVQLTGKLQLSER